MDIIIVGLGNTGKILAKELSEERHDVTVIDIDEALIDNTVERFDVKGVYGSGTHCSSLKDADVKKCDLFISVTPQDEINILACLIARRMGAKHTIARVRDPEYSAQVDFMRNELGISMMINPEYLASLEIFRNLQFPSAMNIESFSNGTIDMVGFKIREESPLCNMKIADMSYSFIEDMLICAVVREDDIVIPNGDFVIRQGDTVYITGSHKLLGRIVKKLSGKKKAKKTKTVMLIGGSRISVYLTKMLIAAGKNVLIVEKNKEKCTIIAEHCPKATIICGDANNRDLLIEEGIEDADAVVTLTDADETNFLVSMMSDNIGIEKNITKINNVNLIKMFEKIDQATHINVPQNACDIITQYIRAKSNVNSSSMKTLYKLVDGRIEAIEFLAEDYVKFIGKPLSSVKLKNNTLIAAVKRHNRIFVPSGNDTIEKNDIVVVVSKGYAIYNLNDILA
ncbi:MAG: Trk system potassium transporter TrkA [Acetobacter sp.]|nr:Trk system potassium transporter TrkA [Bacteroides sp.]MCM1341444.1 Trk system potassium transporter TrkA [Acetobacter sp.]MCM1433396.1 Trk system potassium transporter TrkA [Clostridiales bacterium]